MCSKMEIRIVLLLHIMLLTKSLFFDEIGEKVLDNKVFGE